MATATDEQLYMYFNALCASCATRGSGMILAIEEGTTTDASDDIQKVAQALWDAVNEDFETTWTSKEIAALVPLDSPNRDGFPQVPVHGKVLAECEQGDPMPHWCWALRMGYARDRVIAYGQVKQAMLDAANITTSPEKHAKLFGVWGAANTRLRTHEGNLRALVTRDPEDELKTMRAAWYKATATIGNAHRQQPTMLRAQAVTGLTSLEIEALAADTRLQLQATLDVGKQSREGHAARDALLGTETFVAFSFPHRTHKEMHAVGAEEQGVHVGVKYEHDDFRMPAMVTLHNATGAVEPLCRRMGEKCALNVYMTHDAAGLLLQLHSLIVTARKTVSGGGEPRPRPREEQRNYLLLDHGCL